MLQRYLDSLVAHRQEFILNLSASGVEFSFPGSPVAAYDSIDDLVNKLPDYSMQFRASMALLADFDQIKDDEADKVKELRLMTCLRSAGVDNWDGWDIALEAMETE